MTKIKVKKSFGALSKPRDEEPETLYCPFCKKYDINSILQERRNYYLADKHLWRECYKCGRLIPMYQGMRTRGLVGAIEPVPNPFYETDKRVTGLDNKVKKRVNDEMQSLKARIEKEKDLDIKQELMRGNTVTIIQEDDAKNDNAVVTK